MSMFYLWDLLPILGIAALIVAFVVKRRAMKQEEAELIEMMNSLEAGTKQDENQQA